MGNTAEDCQPILRVIRKFLSGDFSARVQAKGELAESINLLGELIEDILHEALEGAEHAGSATHEVTTALSVISGDIQQANKRALAIKDGNRCHAQRQYANCLQLRQGRRAGQTNI